MSHGERRVGACCGVDTIGAGGNPTCGILRVSVQYYMIGIGGRIAGSSRKRGFGDAE